MIAESFPLLLSRNRKTVIIGSINEWRHSVDVLSVSFIITYKIHKVRNPVTIWAAFGACYDRVTATFHLSLLSPGVKIGENLCEIDLISRVKGGTMSKQVLKSELYQRCRKDLSLLRQMSFGGLPFLAHWKVTVNKVD